MTVMSDPWWSLIETKWGQYVSWAQYMHLEIQLIFNQKIPLWALYWQTCVTKDFSSQYQLRKFYEFLEIGMECTIIHCSIFPQICTVGYSDQNKAQTSSLAVRNSRWQHKSFKQRWTNCTPYGLSESAFHFLLIHAPDDSNIVSCF